MVWYYKITDVTNDTISILYNIHVKKLNGEFSINRKNGQIKIIRHASNDLNGRHIMYLKEKALLKINSKDFEIFKIYQIACG